MKILRDSVFISSVLFSVSLVALVPHSLQYASTWQHRSFQEGRSWTENYFMPIGFASLAVILIGLTVIWMGYIKRMRWTWFVMLVIVCVFAFPLYVLPVLQDMHAAESVNWSAWLSNAIKGPGIYRDYLKGPLLFLLMVVALLLPSGRFLFRGNGR